MSQKTSNKKTLSSIPCKKFFAKNTLKLKKINFSFV